MTLIFKALNPGAVQAIWAQPVSWKLDRYFDKPGQLSLEIAGDHGVADRAIIEAYYESEYGSDSFSDCPFRGYLLPPDSRGNETARLTIHEIQKILEHRWTQNSRWPASTTLTKILTHAWPSAGETPGYLCQANNLVQPGSFIAHSGYVWKLPSGGTAYLGSLHSLGDHVYIDSTQQTWHSSASLTAGKYWQDADYLYIYSVKNPYYHTVLVEGIYETNIRLGTISLASSTFTRSWRSGNAQIYKEITKLLTAHGLEWQFTHAADGYTYLNASAAIGRGANSANYPTYRYDRMVIKKVKRNTTGGNVPLHALRGGGIGKGATRQYYTAASFPAGLRFVAFEEYSSQFSDQLAGTIEKVYANRQDVAAWEIEGESDPAIMPGDYCKIIPEFEAPTIERVKQISLSSGSLMKLYLGQRPKDPEDILKEKYDIRDALQRDLELEFSEISVSGQENVDNTYPCTIILDVPADDWDDELDSKWLLNVDMKAFESSIAQATTAEVHHGSAGTSQTSGSGGDHDDHELYGVTSAAASGSLVQAYGYVASRSVASVPSSHDHDMGGGYNATMSDHKHGFTNPTKPGSAAAHTVPTYSNPQQDAALAQLKKVRDGFGSLAYLTVTITINSVGVPGSPFADIALNESISDIDVTGMITTGKNTVTVAISQYGGSGSVAARANVRLTGKVVVDTYNL